MSEVTMSRSALAELVALATSRGGGDAVALNPQPLPPKEVFGPLPDPWMWSTVAQGLVARMLDRFEAAGIIIVGGAEGRAVNVAAQSISDVVDDLCGTPPRRPLPIPGPHGPLGVPATLHATNLLVVASHFGRAAEALDGHELQGAFANAADKLFAQAAARAV